jgi:hypothetical protein
VKNSATTILNTFSEFLAMWKTCEDYNSYSNLPEAVFAEVQTAAQDMVEHLKRQPTIVRAELKDEPCVQVTENRTVTLTLRKVGCRAPKVGEYFDAMSYPTPGVDKPIVLKMEWVSTVPYDIYEPVKEETIAA